MSAPRAHSASNGAGWRENLNAQLLIGQGTAGLGQEMGLEAMRLALTDPLASMAPMPRPPATRAFFSPARACSLPPCAFASQPGC